MQGWLDTKWKTDPDILGSGELSASKEGQAGKQVHGSLRKALAQPVQQGGLDGGVH